MNNKQEIEFLENEIKETSEIKRELDVFFGKNSQFLDKKDVMVLMYAVTKLSRIVDMYKKELKERRFQNE